ncbi:protein TONSOKU isoform X1 [Elaeis guineensis]|uniref:protein TONSOKU isoform X1 n=1 Tax=Elaeis guineensis var. tenera TaxID=51953 RepID=UPI003C6D5527
MGRGEEEELRAAKRGYRDAEREGNHEEAARWANVVGDILKRRGEYVEALRWLRLDYDVSVKHLPQKQLLPTCQSLGEVYLRLDRFKEALIYQKKHLELAKDSDDLVEQQRASTQLGRTYHEMFLRSENDHHAIRNAKKYFKLAMKLARTLKESSSCEKSSLFIKEFTDAHNNIGMLEMDLDNLEDAKKILLQGLKICDEEEVSENDDGRSRLHNNLGSLYIELREWNKAREHIEKDILICKRICHPQGEAKGFINFGELHYRVQKYDEALLCYQKALDIAKCMEDEDALVDQINQNIQTVKEAAKVLEELKKDEQKLKKLTRTTSEARGTSNERKCLLEQNACLDGLIEKCSMIFAWPKHRELAKRKKRVASELCDKEKLSDSFLAIGESYQKLRNFGKARKWYMKSWNGYKLIGNLEGQALAKINIGEVLDSSGDWAGALEAFEEGYRIAVQGNLPSAQMSALNNIHYSHMIRFDNVEEARKLQRDIEKLKILLEEENAFRNRENDYCSETETEGDDVSNDVPGVCASVDINKTPTITSNLLTTGEEDVPLASLIRRSKNSAKIKMSQLDSLSKKARMTCDLAEASSRDLCKLNDDQQPAGRKRIRVVISDDETDETDEINGSGRKLHKRLVEDVATFEKDNQRDEPIGTNEFQDVSHPSASKDVLSACTPIVEESICSFRSKSPIFTADNGTDFGSSSDAGIDIASKSAASGSKFDSGHILGSLPQRENGAGFNNFNLSEDDNSRFITFKIGDKLIYVDISFCNDGGYLNIECMKAEVACVYYLQLSEERRAKGLLPVIGHLKCSGKSLGPVETFEGLKHLACGKIWIDVVIDGWVPKRLMKLYIDYCGKLLEAPNMKLLKKLYNLEVSEDEVIVSDCGLQDFSISPFLKAMQAHRTVAVLDISHNLLGNETMEKLQQIFTSSSQKYGGLTLDLHCNRFGPTALFQICECSVMFSRLEVLNLSENRLTDACSSYLASILENCKALYSLNIEQCSITSRTVQKVADSLRDGSVLSHLSLGKNSPISGNAMVNLLSKLSSLNRVSELSLTGVRLNKIMVNSLCQLAQSSSLSGLFLGQTYIGTDGAIKLTEALSSGPQELVKLDLSYCGLTSHEFTKVCTNLAVIGGIIELNLGGNSIGQEVCDALGSILVDPQCSLKSLILDKCHLGLAGIIRIVQALADNDSLEELHLAENSEVDQERTLKYDLVIQGSSTPASQKPNAAEIANAAGAVNAGCTGLEVADSEDEMLKEELPTMSGPDGSCASSCQRNPYGGCQLIQELSEAIALAKQLQLLNLSQNGFSEEAIESLYASWSSSRCGAMARKHVSKELIHFLVDGKRCCGVKPCCKRD